MSRNMNRTEFVSLSEELEISPPANGERDYILIQNTSAFDIYINMDTHADILHGFAIAAGLYWERDKGAPQNPIYVSGSNAARQQLNIVEGFAAR